MAVVKSRIIWIAAIGLSPFFDKSFFHQGTCALITPVLAKKRA
jgi:hypothetical protein